MKLKLAVVVPLLHALLQSVTRRAKPVKVIMQLLQVTRRVKPVRVITQLL